MATDGVGVDMAAVSAKIPVTSWQGFLNFFQAFVTKITCSQSFSCVNLLVQFFQANSPYCIICVVVVDKISMPACYICS